MKKQSALAILLACVTFLSNAASPENLWPGPAPNTEEIKQISAVENSEIFQQHRIPIACDGGLQGIRVFNGNASLSECGSFEDHYGGANNLFVAQENPDCDDNGPGSLAIPWCSFIPVNVDSETGGDRYFSPLLPNTNIFVNDGHYQDLKLRGNVFTGLGQGVEGQPIKIFSLPNTNVSFGRVEIRQTGYLSMLASDRYIQFGDQFSRDDFAPTIDLNAVHNFYSFGAHIKGGDYNARNNDAPIHFVSTSGLFERVLIEDDFFRYQPEPDPRHWNNARNVTSVSPFTHMNWADDDESGMQMKDVTFISSKDPDSTSEVTPGGNIAKHTGSLGEPSRLQEFDGTGIDIENAQLYDTVGTSSAQPFFGLVWPNNYITNVLAVDSTGLGTFARLGPMGGPFVISNTKMTRTTAHNVSVCLDVDYSTEARANEELVQLGRLNERNYLVDFENEGGFLEDFTCVQSAESDKPAISILNATSVVPDHADGHVYIDEWHFDGVCLWHPTREPTIEYGSTVQTVSAWHDAGLFDGIVVADPMIDASGEPSNPACSGYQFPDKEENVDDTVNDPVNNLPSVDPSLGVKVEQLSLTTVKVSVQCSDEATYCQSRAQLPGTPWAAQGAGNKVEDVFSVPASSVVNFTSREWSNQVGPTSLSGTQVTMAPPISTERNSAGAVIVTAYAPHDARYFQLMWWDSQGRSHLMHETRDTKIVSTLEVPPGVVQRISTRIRNSDNASVNHSSFQFD